MNKQYDNIKRIANVLLQSHRLKMLETDYNLLREEIWLKINQEIERKRAKRHYLWYAAAACLLALIVLTFYPYKKQVPSIDLFVQQAPVPSLDTKDIKVYLSPDEKVDIQEQHAHIAYSSEGKVSIRGKHQGQHKENAESKKNEKKTEYNQLIVPKGKFTRLTLSDGSVVHVNSGTRVVYPRIFAADHREIFVEGEIYIDVFKNPQAPFIVKTHSCEIEVLGTTFNVNAYNDENKTEVVLVEGSIKLSDKQHNKMKLKPNQLAMLQNDEIKEIREVDAANYTTWKDGILLLQSEQLLLVLKRLERFFGNTIEVSPEAGRLVMHGKIRLNQSLDKIMKLIATTAPISYRKDANGIFHVTTKD